MVSSGFCREKIGKWRTGVNSSAACAVAARVNTRSERIPVGGVVGRRVGDDVFARSRKAADDVAPNRSALVTGKTIMRVQRRVS